MKKIFLIILGSISIFGSGYWVGQRGYRLEVRKQRRVVILNQEKPQTVETQMDMRLFWRALEELERRYVDKEKIDGKRMLYGAIQGLTSSLGDPYTAFFTPQENQKFQDNLEGIYEGIGAQLGFKEGQLVIVSPLEGSPAQQAGVEAGDIVLAVDGESTRGWSIPQAVNRIRGKKGTRVVLTLERVLSEESQKSQGSGDTLGDTSKAEKSPGQPFEVTITRQEIRIPSLRLEWVGKNNSLAHLELLRFGPDTKREWDQKVADLKYQVQSGAVRGLILDLRNNPGGLLDVAVYLGSDFFKDGVVVKRELATGKIEEFKVDHACRLCEVPLRVLVNRGSASASEILAGAIKIRGRGKLVGERTFGKGTVQEAVDLGEGATLHVTTARWLLPDGSNIDGVGIEPDIVVQESPVGADSQREDLQLQKAVQILEDEF